MKVVVGDSGPVIHLHEADVHSLSHHVITNLVIYENLLKGGY
jgi:hypothetical protein